MREGFRGGALANLNELYLSYNKIFSREFMDVPATASPRVGSPAMGVRLGLGQSGAGRCRRRRGCARAHELEPNMTTAMMTAPMTRTVTRMQHCLARMDF